MRGRGFTSLPSASLLLLPVGENLGMAGNEFPPSLFLPPSIRRFLLLLHPNEQRVVNTRPNKWL